jgi:hypothetical protein
MLNALYVHSNTVIKTGMIYSELYMNLALLPCENKIIQFFFFFFTKINGRDCKIEKKIKKNMYR